MTRPSLDSPPSPHLGEGILRLLGHAEWQGEERRRAETHLVSCSACRRRLIEVHEEERASMLEPMTVPENLRSRVEELGPSRARRGPSLWTRRPAWLLAAASLVLILSLSLTLSWPPGQTDGKGDSGDLTLRSRSGTASEGWQLEGPGAGQHLQHEGNEKLLFRWRPFQGALAYQIVVLDSLGTRYFEAELLGAEAEIPSGTLAAGEYVFFVIARLRDGSEEKSPLEPFVVAAGTSPPPEEKTNPHHLPSDSRPDGG